MHFIHMHRHSLIMGLLCFGLLMMALPVGVWAFLAQ